MEIRTAKIEDLEKIVEIYNLSILAGYKTADTNIFSVEQRSDWFYSHSPDKFPIYVAVEDDEIVGYSSLSAYREGRGAFSRTREVSFYIDSAYQGKNIGTELLRHAINRCPALDIKNLVAMLIEGNEASISLLEKFGFQKWGHLPDIAEFDGKNTGQLYYGLQISNN
ncbi:MAG: N-acetyltransferase [Gammaproteobacteria bacterium]|nr:N-acetyltransferase [Gammaproteobacteria bacterium]